jgi:hypothetical protein
MKRFIFTMILLLCFYFSHSQEIPQKKFIDSTLYKYVSGIRNLIETRLLTEGKHGRAKINSWNRNVYIEGDTTLIAIDSLYKYDFNDFKEIKIKIEYNMEIWYGATSPYGRIVLVRREKDKK